MSKILVVDDEPDTLVISELWLTSEGFEVATAADGMAALDVFDRERPDLVITDLMMPRMSGVELCRRLRAQQGGAHLPIVVASAAATAPDTGDNLYDVFITKPVEFDRLIVEIKRLLAH